MKIICMLFIPFLSCMDYENVNKHSVRIHCDNDSPPSTGTTLQNLHQGNYLDIFFVNNSRLIFQNTTAHGQNSFINWPTDNGLVGFTDQLRLSLGMKNVSFDCADPRITVIDLSDTILDSLSINGCVDKFHDMKRPVEENRDVLPILRNFKNLDNLSVLSGLCGVEWLDFSGSTIKNLRLASMEQLKVVNLSNATISALSMMDLDSLEMIDLSFAQISTLAFVDNTIETLNLTSVSGLVGVDLAKSTFQNLIISGLKDLESIRLYDSRVMNFELSDSNSLKILNMPGTDISFITLANLRSLESLQMLGLDSSETNLINLQALKSLYVSYTRVSKLTISDCKSIERLEVFHSQISSFTLSNLAALKTLHWSDFQVVFVNISGMESLETLGWSFCNVSNNAYVDMWTVKDLDIYSCYIKQLSLSSLKSSTFVNWEDSNITKLELWNLEDTWEYKHELQLLDNTADER